MKAASPLASRQDLLDAHVQSLLLLDGQSAKFTSHMKLKGPATTSSSKKKKLKNSEVIVTNSRGSAQQSKIAHVPTFDKKRHRKAQKKASVEKVAKILKKMGKNKPW